MCTCRRLIVEGVAGAFFVGQSLTWLCLSCSFFSTLFIQDGVFLMGMNGHSLRRCEAMSAIRLHDHIFQSAMVTESGAQAALSDARRGERGGQQIVWLDDDHSRLCHSASELTPTTAFPNCAQGNALVTSLF
jgi:hypothetical protein